MKRVLMITASLLLAACDSDRSEERDETIGAEIADDYNQAMEKAQNVELQLQEQKDKLDEAMKEADPDR